MDRVFLSERTDTAEEEDDCCDWGWVARAREERLGDGGAIEKTGCCRARWHVNQIVGLLYKALYEKPQ